MRKVIQVNLVLNGGGKFDTSELQQALVEGWEPVGDMCAGADGAVLVILSKGLPKEEGQ